jgi:uncharacterized membrane protein
MRLGRIDIGKIFHKGFKLGILMKAIDGALEVIGGVLLLFLSPVRLGRVIGWLTQHELSEDPKDIVANFLIRLGSKFTIGTQYFGVFYLVSHGTVKLVLVLLLWRRKVWAYPVTMIALSLFVAYQSYRYTLYHSTGLIFLTLLDVLVILLTFIEYKRIRSGD